MQSRRGSLVSLVGGALILALPLSVGASPAVPRLPDLGVAPLQHFTLELTSDGRKRLRFTTKIANVGPGPIEIVASRAKLGVEFVSSQRIRRADDTSFVVATPGVRMVFVGSKEHGHWHVRGAARYELRRLRDGATVRTRVKRGFCFYDSDPYRRSLLGAPAKRVYPRSGCGEKRALKLSMGISVGWLDAYYWRIPGQEMDITTLPTGRYRLLVKADPRNWFRETNERNNVTWVDLDLGDQTVKMLGRSPRL